MKRVLAWLLLLAATAGAEPNLINLAPAFHRFVEASAGQPPHRLVELWTELVEASQPAYYSELVWDADWGPDRQRALELRLPRLLANAAGIEAVFQLLPDVITRQVARFREVFPDARLDVPIFLAPSFRFDGRTATLPGTGLVLALSPDEIARLRNEPDVLVSHELFHIYHEGGLGLSSESDTPTGSLLTPLWTEGLATWYSAQVNPRATAAQVLMQEDLARLSESDVGWLAAHFPLQGGSHGEWFQTGVGKPRPDLPSRCGYLLGLRVAELLSRRHSPQVMARWSLEQAEPRVREALAELALRHAPQPR